MKKIKLNQLVVVTEKKDGKNKVGLVIAKHYKNKQRVFNLRMEDGMEKVFIPVDNKSESFYINTNLSEKFIENISTNLRTNSSGNFRRL